MIRALIHNAIGILATFIGRPFLLLLAWFRWPFLIFGFFFNTLSTYNPTTGAETHKFTVIPLIFGLVLFSAGSAVKRYEEIANIYRRGVKEVDTEKNDKNESV
ncbi:hypothetical protein [Candidatus Oleimmundimicrobium sp.]|uniref:hypothetical protein n=1 Tax=Candidatus Oleimmundimicrobium sp. TaxID=3060597 RepID=UPI00271DB68F|nr:hypothetical protein [Candidatus Oleimmundimicrobium sp.]MDO8886727.1 hypothetical protein [Candidatus Oleimmundimicrobium sp.]